MLGKGLESLIPPKGNQTHEPREENKPVIQKPEEVFLPKEEPVESLPPVHESPISLPQAQPFSQSDPVTPKTEPPLIDTHLPPKEEFDPRVFAAPKNRQAKKSEGIAIFHIEVEKIRPNPYQPRREFDEENIRELASSIRDFGFIQPLVVSKIQQETPYGIDVYYELIAGERRLMAAKVLGLDRVPAIIREVDENRERLEMAIIENLQRENLNPIEMGRAFARLQDEFRLTQREIASRLGKSREVVANTMRLLDLPPAIQDALQKRLINETTGRFLLSVTDPAIQARLFDDLLHQRLTTRELKDRLKERKENTAPKEFVSPELSSLQEKLSARLGAPVKISQSGDPQAGGGKITISFYSKEELQSLIERLAEESEDAF